MCRARRFICISKVLWRRCFLSMVLLGSTASAVASHPKTDVILLDNGDHLTGEIKSLQNGMLSFKTNATETISLKWTHIKSITSSFDYQVEITGGDRYYGSLAASGKADELRVQGDSDAHDLKLLDIVTIWPIEHGFWKKLDGSINFGLNYTGSNQAVQYNFNGEVNYRTLKRYERLQWNSTFNTQEGGDAASQQSLSFRHNRFLKHELSVFGLASLESNPSQGFDLRTNLGGGVGWSLIRKYSTDLIFPFGLVYVREKVEGSNEVDNSAAALVGFEFASYSYDHPKRTLSVSVNTFTNVVNTPRFRTQLSFKLSWEVFHNFNIGFNVINSYDSRPPTADADKNDISVGSSVGYTF